MFLFNLGIALVCLFGVVSEFFLAEESQSQLRLFVNAIFFGLNAYFAWLQF